jgi:hypothetical protein
MQFIQNGPDIPDRLLQAHEDGKVVFFCGAGISYPAGLPGFEGLVSKLYDTFTTSPTAVENAAIKNGQFDTAIGLLENRITGRREVVRKAIADILTPTDLTNPKATATHRALLGLSRSKDGRHRLITTNFERTSRVQSRHNCRFRKCDGMGWYICTVDYRKQVQLAIWTRWFSQVGTLGSRILSSDGRHVLSANSLEITSFALSDTALMTRCCGT